VELLSHVAAGVEPVPDLGDTRSELLRLVSEAIEHLKRTPTAASSRGSSELSATRSSADSCASA